MPYICSLHFSVLSRLSQSCIIQTGCSIIFKSLAYPDSSQSFARHWHIHTPINHLQDLGISRLRSIVCKIWTYPDFDQSFTRFGHIRTPINHARLWHNRISINHSQDSHQSLARLAYPTHNGHMFGYAQVLQMIDQSIDMPKSGEQLIRVLICQNLVND